MPLRTEEEQVECAEADVARSARGQETWVATWHQLDIVSSGYHLNVIRETDCL